MNKYIGHKSQLYGFELHRLIGGKGDGMRLLEIRNGRGLELTVSLDRCADISRLYFNGVNIGYFSPCGYAAPSYYRYSGDGWLKTFTAGFLTTCGLESVGTPCVDNGETLSLHGSIANIPASESIWFEENGGLTVKAEICDETIFGRKLHLCREISVSLLENSFSVSDTIENTGDRTEPIEILYHMNIGYPILDEDSIVNIPSKNVVPRDEYAAGYLNSCLKMEKPQAEFRECCYYHRFDSENGFASICQPKLGKELEISFNAKELDGFVEWKMMGIRDYVLGLECGNCYPDGRDTMRKNGMLKFLNPGESKSYNVKIKLKRSVNS